MRAYAKPRRDKSGDLHTRKAFDLIEKDHRIKEELQRRNNSGAVQDTLAAWSLCRGDVRLQRLEHFRDKYTAHLSEPDPTIPLPKYDELFPFAVATAEIMQKLANVCGTGTSTLEDWDGEITGSAEALWKPWAE